MSNGLSRADTVATKSRKTHVKVADFGLVADLFQVLPELKAELDKAGK